jgi:hypothetical protein
MKPDIQAACTLAGASLLFVDYDDLEENDPLKAIRSLPTLQIRVGETWKSFVANEYTLWEETLMIQSATEGSDDF